LKFFDDYLYSCGKCSNVLLSSQGYEHDRMCHPNYFLMQNGIDECIHDNKIHVVTIDMNELVPFHLEMCDACADKTKLMN